MSQKLDRRTFIKACQFLGLSLPLQSALGANQKEQSRETGSVVIVGAGAAGLTAGYLLQQQGIEFQILEASSQYGGRMKRTADFADFPIPLGAEWIHVKPGILEEIVNDDSIRVDIETTRYDRKTDFGLYEGYELPLSEFGFTKDSKFINATWFDFFEQYIVPSVESRITYNSPVHKIDYTSEKTTVKTQDGTFSCDQVIVAVPAKMLQLGSIAFNPELPSYKQKAIEKVKVWDGCKAFIEFKQKFYPTFVGFEIKPEAAGQKLYYDAAYGQATNQNILGLFAVGTGTSPYVELNDDDLIQYMLKELDDLFDGQASTNYVKHIFQNWNKEAYARGAYVVDHENWTRVRKLGKSVDNRVFFTGDAYTDGEDWSSVHTAARSARRAVKEILKL